MEHLHFSEHIGKNADIAIDLGTANTLVVQRGEGVIFDQPTVCCFAGSGSQSLLHSAGAQAHALVDRVAHPLRIARPLRSGVLSDMAAGRELIRYAAASARRSWRRRRLRALIGIPADSTEAEQRSLLTAARDAGLAHAVLVPEPLMAAIGTGLAIHEPRGRLIVDCGAGTTEVAVICLGSICLSGSVRVGGDTLDAALIDHLHRRHHFQIGPATAERLKLQLTKQLEQPESAEDSLAVKGHSSDLGLPHTLTLAVGELAGVYDKYIQDILDTIRSTLERTPAELSRDIHDDGIVLTGGASMTGLLGRRITETTGLRAIVAGDPLSCVALGLQRVLEGAH